MGLCYSRKPGDVSPWSERVISGTTDKSLVPDRSSVMDSPEKNRIATEALESGQMVHALTQLEELELCLKAAEEKTKTLTERLVVSEEIKSKLLEQVSWLEEQLEAADNKVARGQPCEDIMHAKNQYIEKLQAEVKASQEQLATHKLKHKRKMKKLQTDLATAKQEAAITVMELNEKIKALYEGTPTPREGNSLEESCQGLPPVEEGDRRISLIMELSTQVSLQTEKINLLEEVLEEKEKKIQQLEAERAFAMVKIENISEAPSACNDNNTFVDIDDNL
ncbi:coiled-coil domain-containing protein 192 isoform X1 [Sarcophilus harrisii]|uniref:Coiled-coil domain containing 192 n=2 Tax=Sarcophilus harrisii TaxID=9305 RepID=A0A7N4PDG2_SARHA|nr:coiled-coil domain-containing protein 192 isoform X1 [Sarcophilus harrisii]